MTNFTHSHVIDIDAYSSGIPRLTTAVNHAMRLAALLHDAYRGATHADNLAYACARCNLHKGQRTRAHDPVSRQLAPLFDPRRQRWTRHFSWSSDGTRILGRTRTGRGTVVALQMNHPTIVRARSLWVSCSIHPPATDQTTK